MSEIIDAACCVFPDGTVRWVEVDQVRETVDAWHMENEDLLQLPLTAGVVHVRMEREVFERVRSS